MCRLALRRRCMTVIQCNYAAETVDCGSLKASDQFCQGASQSFAITVDVALAKTS